MRRRRRRHIQIDDNNNPHEFDAAYTKSDNQYDLGTQFDERDQQNDDDFTQSDLQVKLAKFGW